MSNFVKVNQIVVQDIKFYYLDQIGCQNATIRSEEQGPHELAQLWVILKKMSLVACDTTFKHEPVCWSLSWIMQVYPNRKPFLGKMRGPHPLWPLWGPHITYVA